MFFSSVNLLREVSFLPRGGRGIPKIEVIRYFFPDQKGIKTFFKIYLYFLKETKYFVKHFRFQRKGLSDEIRGRNLQWDLLSQCKSFPLHSDFDIDFS